MGKKKGGVEGERSVERVGYENCLDGDCGVFFFFFFFLWEGWGWEERTKYIV